MIDKIRDNPNKSLFIVIIILAFFAPFLLIPFLLTVLIRILYMTILTYSLSFLAGKGGMVSLGQTLFFGLSGYTLAIMLMRHGHSHSVAIPGALGIAVLGAIIIGLITIRTSGVYFIMITLALGQMAWAIALQWSTLTHGDDGIIGIRPPEVFGFALTNRLNFYYLLLISFILIFFFLRMINLSKFGLALKAVSNNPDKVQALGYNTSLIRYIAFIISGFIAGLSALFFVYYNGIISPVTVGINQAVWILVAAILGGMNSLVGPLIGVTTVILMEVQLSRFTDRYMMIIGTVFILVILFMPEGIWGKLRELRR